MMSIKESPDAFGTVKKRFVTSRQAKPAKLLRTPSEAPAELGTSHGKEP